MTDRERLERAVRDALFGPRLLDSEELVAGIVDAVERAMKPEPPPPPKVWPGLDAVAEARSMVWRKDDRPIHLISDQEYTAIAAEGWRQMVKSLGQTTNEEIVYLSGWPMSRSALLAVADPYDGGGK